MPAVYLSQKRILAKFGTGHCESREILPISKADLRPVSPGEVFDVKIKNGPIGPLFIV
jgi:hypothetical protein